MKNTESIKISASQEMEEVAIKTANGLETVFYEIMQKFVSAENQSAYIEYINNYHQ
jgi:capsular polysaccharide biosynthesis protein